MSTCIVELMLTFAVIIVQQHSLTIIIRYGSLFLLATNFAMQILQAESTAKLYVDKQFHDHKFRK